MEQIVTIIESSDSQAWLRTIHALPKRFQDIFLFPGYARLFEAIYQAKASLFCFTRGSARAIQVVLRRPVHTLSFFSQSRIAPEVFDMITPEYSGPVIVCSPEEYGAFVRDFWQAFNEFALKQNIVAEFGRLNPYYNNEPELLNFISATPNRQIVAIDLTLDQAKIMKGFSKGNRGSIHKAQRTGVIARRVDPGEYLSAFHALYDATMQRNSAAQFYRFPLSFFNDLFTHLKENATLFVATLADKTIAASIFLHYNRYIHYYFSGSDVNYLNACPNNLLLHEAIQWAKAQGFEIFSLGGGYHHSGNDSLFSFKSSFSDTTRPFLTYTRVHNQDMYAQLCDAYVKSGGAHNAEYFPLYRG